MSATQIEVLGVVLVIASTAAAVASCWVLAGWPWALALFAVIAAVLGVLLIRTAALTAPKPKGGESE